MKCSPWMRGSRGLVGSVQEYRAKDRTIDTALGELHEIILISSSCLRLASPAFTVQQSCLKYRSFHLTMDAAASAFDSRPGHTKD